MANAIPTERMRITTGPSLGLVNHPKISRVFIKMAVKAKMVIKVIQNLPLLLVSTEAQKTAVNELKVNSQPKGTFGSDKKLLNSIAIYCLRSTATQNIGSEKSRNAKNVIV
jgi:hypothetical protein